MKERHENEKQHLLSAAGQEFDPKQALQSQDPMLVLKNLQEKRAIEAANNLSTTKIKVGQKLKIPAKAEAAAPAPPAETTAAPVLPPVSAPAPVTPTPAPGK